MTYEEIIHILNDLKNEYDIHNDERTIIAEALSAAIKAIHREMDFEQMYAGWVKDAEQVKSYYPDFDFITEMQNPLMLNLLKAKIPLKTAFEVIHLKTIVGENE